MMMQEYKFYDTKRWHILNSKLYKTLHFRSTFERFFFKIKNQFRRGDKKGDLDLVKDVFSKELTIV